MKYLHVIFRILITLAFAAAGFVAGLSLPLLSYELIHGDPGMPFGAALGLFGITLGILGAMTGLANAVIRFPWWIRDSGKSATS
jgi:hypothetical protein